MNHHEPNEGQGAFVGPPAVRTDRICVLMNGGSGKRRGEEAERELRALLADRQGRYELRTPPGEDIEAEAHRALRDGFGVVVAAGGDGTICAVASALVGSDCRMGVLPMGTFNYFARSLDLPDTLPECLAVIEAGEARPVKVGEVNGRVFLNNASLGAYPAILRRREDVYRRWGRSRLAAYWSLLTTLMGYRRPLRVTVRMQGFEREFRTPLVFVANNPYQLEQLGMDGVECTRGGDLALFIAADRTGLDLVRSALRLARGAAERHDDFEMRCGNGFEITTRKAVRLVARDGEKEHLEGPFRFSARAGALQVLAPFAPGEA